MILLHLNQGGRDRAVGIATSYILDGPDIESRWELNYPHASRPSVGTNQLPMQRVMGISRSYSVRGVALTTNPILRRGWRKSRAKHLLPLWSFKVCSGVNFNFNFTFTPKPGQALVRSSWAAYSSSKTVNSKTQGLISQGRSVSVVTRLRVERGSFRGEVMKFCLRPDRLWDPWSILFNWYREFFAFVKAAVPWN
jgi:hypothetical protein